MAAFAPGQIVLVDWRDALPKGPNKLRPAIVVEDADLFDPGFPNVILVPLSEDHELAPSDLLLPIDPTPENGSRSGVTRCLLISLRHPLNAFGRPSRAFFRSRSKSSM